MSASESPLKLDHATQLNGDGVGVEQAPDAMQPRAESLLTAAKRTLAMIASGASLTDILENLCGAIEAQNPDMRSTVMLMDPDGRRLWPVGSRRHAVPNLRGKP